MSRAGGGPPGRVVGRSWVDAVRVSGGDAFVRWHVHPAAVREVRCGTAGGGTWWSLRVGAMSYWEDGALLVAGDPDAVAAVAGPLRRATAAPDLTVPAAAAVAAGGASGLGLDPDRTFGWAWQHATRPLPPVRGEEQVAWDPPGSDVARLLDEASPHAFVRPGHPWARRWAGVRGDDGRLLACGAVTEHVPGVPHLAAVATRPAVRGRGLAGAVTAAMTRSLLRRAPAVTLALWASNDAARRTYARIGFRPAHDFVGGPPA
ncbi:GNAT family N-acetyltransferase [Aquipuribacter nitratireducens]|uniref:GNAT family N-acetyltransferase n=1 Tax=Aquipuribacter nitratireducens TaxID=650104 RepID=A0ABW0GP91_9MICO